MTKNTNHITELVFILDRSGSMAGLVSDTIGGFNSMIEVQKKRTAPSLYQPFSLTMKVSCFMTACRFRMSAR